MFFFNEIGTGMFIINNESDQYKLGKKLQKNSVADPGCLSRILIFSFRIPDLGSRIQQQQKRGGGKFVV